MSELVSIITPVYNGEKYIEDTILSVLSQNYQDWELIIIDDCSTDMSINIVEKYKKRDRRIKLISLQINQGVAIARNMGLKAANGKYIAFLDSDDLWHSQKLLKQIEFMNNNNYYFTFTNYELIDEEGIRLNRVIKGPSAMDYQQLLKGNKIGCLTVMINKEKISNLEMPLINHEDYATWLYITKKGYKAYCLNENLALYRKSKTSISSNKFKAITWTWKIYRTNQKLGIYSSIKYFIFYVLNASLKHFSI